MTTTEKLTDNPDLFKKVYPNAHPLAGMLWRLRFEYADDIPEELIPNDPGVSQTEKARKGFWSSIITAMDILVDDGVILDKGLEDKTRQFITHYQERRFKNDHLTRPADVRIANAFLNMGLTYSLNPRSRN